ncbi:hypothetical protein BU15DRAFT_79046 [Melanogaster broomeanus]|nr:hypothetical protein BU15DRAFT_79046 [Melanogaster broomeanus]
MAWVLGLAITSDGKRILSGINDEKSKVWDVECRSVLKNGKVAQAYQLHSISPDEINEGGHIKTFHGGRTMWSHSASLQAGKSWLPSISMITMDVLHEELTRQVRQEVPNQFDGNLLIKTTQFAPRIDLIHPLVEQIQPENSASIVSVDAKLTLQGPQIRWTTSHHSTMTKSLTNLVKAIQMPHVARRGIRQLGLPRGSAPCTLSKGFVFRSTLRRVHPLFFVTGSGSSSTSTARTGPSGEISSLERDATPARNFGSGTEIKLFSAHGHPFSLDHRDATIRCWNSANGELIGEPWTGHTSIVTSLSLSPDGTKIASASVDKTIRFWDAQSGDSISRPPLHESSLRAVTFSPSGEFVAAGEENGKLSIWRVPWWDEYQKKLQAYEALLDLPAVPAPKGLSSVHAQDKFNFHDLPTGATSAPLGRPAPIATRVQHLWRGLIARNSPSSPTLSATEDQPTSQERRFWKSPRVVVAKSLRKCRKEKKHRNAHKPPRPQTHAGADPYLLFHSFHPSCHSYFSQLDPSHAVAGPSSSHAQPSGAPSKAGPSTPQAGPSTPKPATEGRASGFVQSYAGSDDSWDDLDGCGKCLDYFCGGPRSDRERFRPWRKKSPAVIEAEQRLKEAKRAANAPTKKHGRTPQGPASLTRQRLRTSEQNEEIRRQLDQAVAAKRKAEAERDYLLEKNVRDLRNISHTSRESTGTSHAPRFLGCGGRYLVIVTRAIIVHVESSCASLDGDEASSGRLRNNSQVEGSDPHRGILQRQETTEETHRRPDDEAVARQKAEAKLDWLEKEEKELRDIISLASREPLERQTQPGLSVVEAGPSSSFAEPSCFVSNPDPSTSQVHSSTPPSDPAGN